MVTFDEFEKWLERHGIDVKTVFEVAFVPEGVGRSGPIKLRVGRYALNDEGNKYVVRDADGSVGAAREVVFIELQALPGALV